ncbi:MAG: TonB-dependent receptor plug domain-containing protein [Gemmatimonadaceae bacterium]
MRRIIVVAVLLSAAVGCSAERLTGASAQRAVAQGKAQFQAIPDSIVVFVDDVRLPAGSSLQHLRPETVERVEVVKGGAAVAQYGAEAKGGAIRIYTKKSR